MMEWLAMFLLFAGTYGVLMVCAYLVDKILWRFFDRGIFPRDYFKW